MPAEAQPHVIWLQDCTGDCLALVGGKARSLGALLEHGFRVPPGFAVSTGAYREHVLHNRLAEPIERLLNAAAEAQSFEAQQRAADEIRQLFEASRPSSRLEDEVL